MAGCDITVPTLRTESILASEHDNCSVVHLLEPAMKRCLNGVLSR